LDISIESIAIQGVITCPFLSFLFFAIFNQKAKTKTAWVGMFLLTTSCFFSIVLFHQTWIKNQVYQVDIEWFELKNHLFQFKIWIDKTTTALFCVVSLISTLVHLFSMTYMKGDKYYGRYFALLGVFTFAMQALLLTSNLLLIYIFWELVGFCSYLLISFWYEKPAAARAAKKAFMFNRVGDMGFLLAITVVYFIFQTLDIQELSIIVRENTNKSIQTNANNSVSILLGMGFVLATCGKSAQLPLSVWLPDAMEAPTPVSALIHAATMVAAGIYLLIRVQFLLVSEIQLVVVIIGVLTALSAAFSAFNQTDIKKLLAYSTVSQLGFMMVAVGIGTTQVALFHLLTHAFFKAGLFLCAGVVIHHLHIQDMREMGSLRKKMPVVFISYSICAFSLAGLPFFSGFLSKDLILHQAMLWAASQGFLFYIIPTSLFLTSLLTAIYIGKQWRLVFFEKEILVDESPINVQKLWQRIPPLSMMEFSILILAIFSLGFIFSLHPFLPARSWVMNGQVFDVSHWITVFSSFIACMGMGIGWQLGKQKVSDKIGNRLITNNTMQFSIDNFYQKTIINGSVHFSNKLANFDSNVVDRTIRFVGFGLVTIGLLAAWGDKYIVDGGVRLSVWAVRKSGQKIKAIQNGKVQSYFAWALVGMLILLIFLVYL
jgi:NADH-quinone oxidoreductase subunit L